MRRSDELSRFGAFIKQRKLTVRRVAYRAGVSPRYICSLTWGDTDPTRAMMVRITDAVRGIVGRRVTVSELFDLGDGNGE